MSSNKTIEVCFLGGECRNALEGSCDFMLATVIDDNGDEVELYAEVPVKGTPFDVDDDSEDFDVEGFSHYSYPLLKAEIIQQAIANGIDPERLKFHWD